MSLEVAPNPFTNSTQIIVSSSVNEKVTVKISDLSGFIVYENVQLSNQNYSVGENLPAGVYIVQAQMADIIKTGKIVKQ